MCFIVLQVSSDQTSVPGFPQETNNDWDNEESVVSTTLTKIPDPCVKVGDSKTASVVFIESPDKFYIQVKITFIK